MRSLTGRKNEKAQHNKGPDRLRKGDNRCNNDVAAIGDDVDADDGNDAEKQIRLRSSAVVELAVAATVIGGGGIVVGLVFVFAIAIVVVAYGQE